MKTQTPWLIDAFDAGEIPEDDGEPTRSNNRAQQRLTAIAKELPAPKEIERDPNFSVVLNKWQDRFRLAALAQIVPEEPVNDANTPQTLDAAIQQLEEDLKNQHENVFFETYPHLQYLQNFDALVFKLEYPSIKTLNDEILGPSGTDELITKIQQKFVEIFNKEARLIHKNFKGGKAILKRNSATLEGKIEAFQDAVNKLLLEKCPAEKGSKLRGKARIILGITPFEKAASSAQENANAPLSADEFDLAFRAAEAIANATKIRREHQHDQRDTSSAKTSNQDTTHQRKNWNRWTRAELEDYLKKDFGEGLNLKRAPNILARYQETVHELKNTHKLEIEDSETGHLKQEVITALRKGTLDTQFPQVTPEQKENLIAYLKFVGIFDIISPQTRELTLQENSSVEKAFQTHIQTIVEQLRKGQNLMCMQEKMAHYKTLWMLAQKSPKNINPEAVISQTGLAIAQAIMEHQKAPDPRPLHLLLGDVIGFGSINVNGLINGVKQWIAGEKNLEKTLWQAGSKGNIYLRIIETYLSELCHVIDSDGGDEIQALIEGKDASTLLAQLHTLQNNRDHDFPFDFRAMIAEVPKINASGDDPIEILAKWMAGRHILSEKLFQLMKKHGENKAVKLIERQ